MVLCRRTRHKAIRQPTTWVRAGMRFLPLTILRRTIRGKTSRRNAMPSEQAARQRSHARKAGEAAIRRVRSMAAPAVSPRCEDDVGLRGFKLAPIVHFGVYTGRRSTGRTIAASDVNRCLRMQILLGQIHWACLYNFMLTAKVLVTTISVQNLA